VGFQSLFRVLTHFASLSDVGVEYASQERACRKHPRSRQTSVENHIPRREACATCCRALLLPVQEQTLMKQR